MRTTKAYLLFVLVVFCGACASSGFAETPAVVQHRMEHAPQDRVHGDASEPHVQTVSAQLLGKNYVVRRNCDPNAAGQAQQKFYPDLVYSRPVAKRFPVPLGCRQDEKVSVHLLSQESVFSHEELEANALNFNTRKVLNALANLDHRIADWTVLLPLGEEYPELQFKRWSVGLDGGWSDVSPIPYLCWNRPPKEPGPARLELRWGGSGSGWLKGCQLIAFTK